MKLIKTETGQQAFKARSPLFSARQRTAFIMFDGQKSVDQVLAAASSLGLTAEDVEHMVAHEFLAPAPGEAVLAQAQAAQDLAVHTAAEAFKARTPQERYTEAKPLATKLTAALGLRGFRLNLAVESAGGYDELLTLLPKIRDAAGAKACEELERVLTQ
ncbi:MAG: hypothetical protein V4627_19720 [Pseudomonadota bacterium]